MGKARLQSLLGYLLFHAHRPQTRAHLAHTFWPDSTESQARTNLRRELFQLRHTFPQISTFLNLDSQTITLIPGARCETDAVVLQQHLLQASTEGDLVTRRQHLEAAINLYHGELLPGLFDDWIVESRAALSEAYAEALERLAGQLSIEREYPAAIHLLSRLLRHDPLHETAYHQLMELYALNHQRARALQVYHTYAAVLERELGVEPSVESQKLYQQLTRSEVPDGATLEIDVRAVRLLGRHKEWETLLASWRTANRGRATFVMIEGEAGIGRTRLADELLNWAERQGISVARARAYDAEGQLAYAPLVTWLRTPALQVPLADLDDIWLVELTRLLPELSHEYPHLLTLITPTDPLQRQHLFEALVQVVTLRARPLILFIDDLQWCDQETLEWLHYLMRSVPDAPLLLLATARPEEVRRGHPLQHLIHSLLGTESLITIPLRPLSREDTQALAEQICGRALDSTEADRLFSESEGNPLFIVEMMRTGYYAHGGYHDSTRTFTDHLPQPAIGLPQRIRALIQARLSQLSPTARQLAGVAATIGRSFTTETLLAACLLDEDSVTSALDELWRRRIIREQGLHSYDFTHERIRDVAYESIGPAQRPLCHRRVAEALESAPDADLDAVGGQLAAHYYRANDLSKAIEYCLRVAVAGRRQYAHEDAVTYLRFGLNLLGTLPESPARTEQELALQSELRITLADLPAELKAGHRRSPADNVRRDVADNQ